METIQRQMSSCVIPVKVLPTSLFGMGIQLIHNLRLHRLDLHTYTLAVFCSFYVCCYFLETAVILKPVLEVLLNFRLVTLFLLSYALLFRNLCDDVVLTLLLLRLPCWYAVKGGGGNSYPRV